MRKERKNYTPEEKIAILRRYLIDKVPLSQICEEHHLQTTTFYQWMKRFFDNGAAAFEKPERAAETEQRRIAALEKKLQTKNDVLAELMEEHVALKKSLGES